jgi:hypothetical protein
MNSDVKYAVPGVAICEANRKKNSALPKAGRMYIIIIIVAIL